MHMHSLAGDQGNQSPASATLALQMKMQKLLGIAALDSLQPTVYYHSVANCPFFLSVPHTQ
jgi:hypothetical protein